jgi:hypothetical protein
VCRQQQTNPEAAQRPGVQLPRARGIRRLQKPTDLAREAVGWNFYDCEPSLLTREPHTLSAPVPALVYFLLGQLVAQTGTRTGELHPVLEYRSLSHKTSSLAAARLGGADPDQKACTVTVIGQVDRCCRMQVWRSIMSPHPTASAVATIDALPCVNPNAAGLDIGAD